MFIPIFYTVNLLILLSGLLGLRKGSGERDFSLALVQTLLILPLLAGEYLYLANRWELQAVRLVLFSEVVFALIWVSWALRMKQATQAHVRDSRRHFLIEIIVGAVTITAAWWFLAAYPGVEVFDTNLSFTLYGPVFFLSFLVLMGGLYSAWRLEEFWRSMDGVRRWEYKFLVVGGYLVCGTMAWASSYRLTYLDIVQSHLQLLSALMFFGWTMIFYAVVSHRLLNRRIFVSRKVVYAFVVPSLLAIYLLGFGLVTLLIRSFGLELSFVLKWLFLVLGFVAIGLFAFSGKIRRRVQFFISTHFYINKYEYRDEWLTLSQQLQGASTEADVVRALREVLAESLYTTEIFIWLEESDASQGYQLVSVGENPEVKHHQYDLRPNDPLVSYLQTHSYFDVNEKEPDEKWQEAKTNKQSLFADLQLSLVAPVSIGNQLTGLIGLGPEFTGGNYGHDDFDLLTALGSQTASALLAVRMAEKLAHAREQQAWYRLSAFVLHDIKNAATMLSLLQENAPEHIHEPEFQQDMLELVDDALRRMGRVEQCLGTLKDEITPELQDIELGRFLQGCVRRIKKQLPLMEIIVADSDEIQVRSDPDLLGSVLENLLLNAYEARQEGSVVRLTVGRDAANQAVVEILDNGPGISADLLPDGLFEPFKTSKDGGSGIGLWQVKRVVAALEGTVSANNNPDGGARFVVRLPLSAGVEKTYSCDFENRMSR